MKALIQRVRGKCSISFNESNSMQNLEYSFDGVGLVVLLGWMQSDLSKADLDAREDWMLSKICGLRIFEDGDGKMNLSLADHAAENKLQAGILWVPQFTLAAELDSGFRPSFIKAMNPESAKLRYLNLIKKINAFSKHNNIFGSFGADMQLSFTNWGPVSIILER